MRRCVWLLLVALAACTAQDYTPQKTVTVTSPPVPVVSWLDTTRKVDTVRHVDTTYAYDTALVIDTIGKPPAPLASFTASCSARLVCAFDGSASIVPAGVLAYSWYFGDGTAAGAKTVPAKTYRVAGRYFVRFVVTDKLRRTAAAADSITVGTVAPPPAPPPATVPNAGPPSTASGTLNRPWLVYSYTDFYCPDHAGVCDSTFYATLGHRVDRLTNGNAASWRAVNPHIEQVQYTLYWFTLATTADTLGASGIASVDTFLVAHGYPIEAAFLHHAGGPADRAHRLMWVAQDGDSAVAFNPADPGFRAYQTQRLAALKAAGYAGVFYDVFGRGAMARAFSSAEGDSAWYQSELASALRAERTATGATIIVNTASYDTPFDSLCIVAAGGAHLEKTNYPLGQNLASQLKYWQWIDHLVAAGATRLEFVSNLAWTDKVPAAVGTDVSAIGREKMAEYASYLMVKDTGSVVAFAPDNYWNQSPATHWLAAWDTAIGAPLGARQLRTSGTDPAGQKYQLWQRQYGRAIVLMRTQGSPVTNFGDSSAIAVPLGVSGRVLRSDGSGAPPDSIVHLRAGEGVVLLTP